VVGDCKRIVCTASGTTTSMPADNDPPASPDPCNVKSCASGTVLTTPAMDGVSCGNGLFCKSAVCSGCQKKEDCPMAPECQDPVCKNNACTYDVLPDGTEVGDNSNNTDCMRTICTSGVKEVVPDTSEIPASDGNMCTSDTCTVNGLPLYTALPNDTVCGMGTDKCCGGACCTSSGAQYCLNGTTCCASGKICGATCCNSAASVCSGALNDMCCASGNKCGANCCAGATDGCATGDVCCPAAQFCSISKICCGAGKTCPGGTVCAP